MQKILTTESDQKKNINYSYLMLNPINIFSFGFGSGLLPYAPGTWGTLITYPLYYLVTGYGIPYIPFFIIYTLVSCYSAGYTANKMGEHDAASIVCDEISGYLFVLYFVPHTMMYYIFSFLLFRFYDIKKPYPIRQLDAKVTGGIGIVIDDLLAGIYTVATIIFFQIIFRV